MGATYDCFRDPLVAAQPALGTAGLGVVGRLGDLGIAESPAGCVAGSVRRAGDCPRHLPGKAPQVIEDQVTYPLTTTLLSVPGAKTVRGFSMFGDAYVYVLFEDGTNLSGRARGCWRR